MNTKKYEFLDSLRGLAIVMVLIYHLDYLGVAVPVFTESFIIGVALFFIISAYTLALSQDAKTITKNTWKNFYMKRFFRIYPLFFCIITLVYIASFRRDIFSSVYEYVPGWINYITHLFFVYGFSPDTMNTFHLGEWSLFNEAFFYLLFPILFIYMRKSWKNTILLFITSVIIFRVFDTIAFSTALKPYTDQIFEWRMFIYHFPLYHLPDFTMGFILFRLHRKWFHNPLPNKILIPLSLVHVAGFAYLIYINAAGTFINHLVRVLMFGGLAWFMMQGGGIYSILNNRILSYFGKISYSLYLLNLPIIFSASAIIRHYDFNIIWGSIITIILLLCIASITYKFELRGIGLGKRFEKR